MTSDKQFGAALGSALSPKSSPPSLKEFIETVGVDETTGERIKVPQWQLPIIQALEDPEYRYVLLLTPRSHGKTSSLRYFICYSLGLDRNLRFIICSATEDQATAFGLGIEQTIRSRAYKEIFENVIPDRNKWTDTQKFLVRTRQSKDPSMLFCGIESSVVVGKRADCVVGDDLIEESRATSAALRAKVSNWLFKALSPTLEPQGRLIICGTLWSSTDLYNEILRKWLPVKVEETPNGFYWLNKPYAVIVLRTSPEHPLWPERWDSKRLQEKLQLIGSLRFAQQYMNEVFDARTSILPLTALKRIPAANVPWDQLTVILGIDPNISEKESADYFAVSVFGLHEQRIYLLNCYRFRGSLLYQKEYLKSLVSRYKPAYSVMETNHFQALQKQLFEEDFYIVPHITMKDKLSRMADILPLFESAKVAIPDPLPDDGNMEDFMEEWALFPTGRYDDCLSAVEIALSQITTHGIWQRAEDILPGSAITYEGREEEAEVSTEKVHKKEGSCYRCGRQKTTVYSLDKLHYLCSFCFRDFEKTELEDVEKPVL